MKWITTILEQWGAFKKEFGIEEGNFFAWFVIIAFLVFISQLSVPYLPTIYFIALALPVVLPFIFFEDFVDEWIKFVQTRFTAAQGTVLLEVRMPRDVFKSPEAMEQVFVQLYQSAGSDNYVESWWGGKCPPVYSFEIVSTEGAIHFYIHAPRKKFKNMIEVHLYAQYPGIEIREVDLDYTAAIPHTLEGYGLMGFHFGRNNQVGAPIRTYVDWGLNDFPKEENKIDPLGTLIEAFGSCGASEHLWMQFVITPNIAKDLKRGYLHEKPDAKEDYKKAIEKQFGVKTKDAEGKEKMEMRKLSDLTEHEKTLLNAMRRQQNKYLFNTVMRGIYVARADRFNGDRISLLAAAFRSFDVPGFGSINPGRFRTDVDWPWWQNRNNSVVPKLKKDIMKYYKLRATKTFKGLGASSSGDKDTVFSTEELATLWHPPSGTVAAPGLGRIESTRGEAPRNLPI